MKKSILLLLVLLVVALAGIGGWLLSSVHQSKAVADEYVQWAHDQKVIPIEFSVAAPPETPADQILYLSGDSLELGSWDASGGPLHLQNDGRYHATVSVLSGIPHKFKVTRGTWGTVERGTAGADIADHDFTATSGAVVDSSVATWVDKGKST